MDPHRSYEPIDDTDLQRLAALALTQLQVYMARDPAHRARFTDLHIATVLCQGAGQHYVNGAKGVKDFDLCHFFRADSGPAFPHRVIWNLDFGPSKFGRDPSESVRYTGRRLDIQGRSIAVTGDVVASIQNYLRHGKSETTPWYFAKAGMVALHPATLRGTVIWPASRVKGVSP